MAIEYKRLGTAIPGTTKTVLYTVPSGKQAIVSSLVVTPTFSGVGTQTFSLYALTSAGETESNSNTLGLNLTVSAGTPVVFTEGWTLGAGETIAVTSASGSGLNFNLFGSEIS